MTQAQELATVDHNQHLPAPQQVTQDIAHATHIATELAKIISSQHLYTKIGGKEHVHAEGWQTISALDRATWITEWVKPLILDDQMVGVEAKVSITKDGVVISSGIMACGYDEFPCKGKQGTAKYRAAASSAQTWAGAKAARQKYAWIMVLAGYSPTPAEEMQPATHTPRSGPPMTKEQSNIIAALANEQGVQKKEIAAKAEELFGSADAKKLTSRQATIIIEWLEPSSLDDLFTNGEQAGAPPASVDENGEIVEAPSMEDLAQTLKQAGWDMAMLKVEMELAPEGTRPAVESAKTMMDFFLLLQEVSN